VLKVGYGANRPTRACMEKWTLNDDDDDDDDNEELVRLRYIAVVAMVNDAHRDCCYHVT